MRVKKKTEQNQLALDNALSGEEDIPLERENTEFRVPQRIPTQRMIIYCKTIPARDVVKSIKKFNGQDEMGVEPLISLVKRLKAQCSNPGVLLNCIMAKKSKG